MTPFFLVFLSAYIGEDQDPESYNISLLPQPILAAIEADSYWCLSKLLDGIQDNFTHAQPGIQRQIVKLRELICRIDGKLSPQQQQQLQEQQQKETNNTWMYHLKVNKRSFNIQYCLYLFFQCRPHKISAAGGSPSVRTRRVHSIFIPMDELPADARSDLATYHPHVGYIFGKNGRMAHTNTFWPIIFVYFRRPVLIFALNNPKTLVVFHFIFGRFLFRLSTPTASPSSTCMCARRS